MANAFLKAQVIAATALGLLQREIVLPRLVWSDAVTDFTGAANDTVSIRVPALLTNREYGWRNDRSADIILDELTESKVDVTLNHDLYSAVAVTDEQLTLDIRDFGAQVLQPQTSAVAYGLENGLAAAIQGATYKTTIDVSTIVPDAGEQPALWQAIVQARTALNKQNVPAGGRVLLMGADFEAALLNVPNIVKVNEAGSDSALTEATLGRLAGFTLVTSNAIAPDAAYAFVPSAFILATRAPMVPQGATFGTTQSFDGIAMRWIRDYDPNKLRDRSVVNLYSGYTVVKDNTAAPGVTPVLELVRAVKLTLDATP